MQAKGSISPRSAGWVYGWCARCSLVGWIEYLMVRADAPATVLEAAELVLKGLYGYPVFDEGHWSDLEWEENMTYWAECSVRDRLDHIQRSGAPVSIFAARRSEFPDDPDGSLYNWIRD